MKKLLLSILLLTGASGIQAQDNAGEGSTVVYPANYFAEYAPVTAQDMLDRIPGLDAGQRGGGGFGGGGGGPGGGGGQRGLGDGGGGNQILINGKRLAGKSNQASTQLGRISAELVDFVEIIRGTSGELDIRGSGQVVNVVLFEEYNDSTISYEANMDRYWDDTMQPGGSLSYGGQAGKLNYLVSAQAEPRYEYRLYKENSILGDFSPNDTIREERTREQTQYEYTFNLGYEINDRSSARLNGLYGNDDFENTVDRWTTDIKVEPNTVSQELENNDADRYNWELGGDYEYNFTNGSRFKVLFIANQRDDDQLRERFDVIDNGDQSKNLYLATTAVNEERIVRGSYTMNLGAGQSVEMGVERALTTLNSTLRLATDGSGTPSPEYGGLVPVDVSNANSTVEEIRYEPFAVHNWSINNRMTLETTLKYETSEIEQSGDVYNKRDFNFVKPKLDYRFDITPVLQLRTTIEKTVSQLSFSDFVAASDFNDNDSNVQAGNVQLQQEEAWEYELNLEYRLPNDVGVVDGSIFYYDLENVIDRIDVSPSPDNLQSANGNIGDGIRYGMRANASIRLGFINLPNILTTTRLTLQDSEVTDPFLGIERRIRFNDRGRIELGFRHDLPRWNMNYGLTWNKTIDGGRANYDLEDIEYFTGDPFTTAFVEYVTDGGITFRLDGRSLLNNKRCRERQRYVGSIADNILEEIEDSCSTNGAVYALKINGTF